MPEVVEGAAMEISKGHDDLALDAVGKVGRWTHRLEQPPPDSIQHLRNSHRQKASNLVWQVHVHQLQLSNEKETRRQIQRQTLNDYSSWRSVDDLGEVHEVLLCD